MGLTGMARDAWWLGCWVAALRCGGGRLATVLVTRFLTNKRVQPAPNIVSDVGAGWGGTRAVEWWAVLGEDGSWKEKPNMSRSVTHNSDSGARTPSSYLELDHRSPTLASFSLFLQTQSEYILRSLYAS